MKLGSCIDNSLLPIESIRPCTPLQAGLITQLLQSTGLYINYMSVDLSEWRDSATINRIMNNWIARNPILRSAFIPLDQSNPDFVMITYKSSKATLWSVKAENQTHLQLMSDWRRAATSEILETTYFPPWRALLECQEGRIRMHLLIFHALFDAHSLHILLGDLAELLEPTISFRPSPVSGYDPIIAEILAASQCPNDENTLPEHGEFWKKHLSEISVTKFPNMCPLHEISQSATIKLQSSRSLGHLECSLRENGVSLQAVAQAAWAQVLSAYTGEQNVVFGVVLSGRDILPQAGDVAFPCITTVPCAARITEDGRRLVDDMMSYNSQIRRYQFCQRKDISRWAGLPNEALFDTILAIQRFAGPDTASRNWSIVEEIASDEVNY
jgi:hypothetical protein